MNSQTQTAEHQACFDVWRGQVRLPRPLAEWVRERGQRNFRSINAEMVELIRRAKEAEEKGMQQ